MGTHLFGSPCIFKFTALLSFEHYDYLRFVSVHIKLTLIACFTAEVRLFTTFSSSFVQPETAICKQCQYLDMVNNNINDSEQFLWDKDVVVGKATYLQWYRKACENRTRVKFKSIISIVLPQWFQSRSPGGVWCHYDVRSSCRHCCQICCHTPARDLEERRRNYG